MHIRINGEHVEGKDVTTLQETLEVIGRTVISNHLFETWDASTESKINDSYRNAISALMPEGFCCLTEITYNQNLGGIAIFTKVFVEDNGLGLIKVLELKVSVG